MAGFVTDNAFEIELNKTLQFAETLKRDQTALMNTFMQLPQKEKVLTIQKIQNGHKQIAQFIEKAKQQELYNSGIKFKIENLKQKLSALQSLWKKVENKI